MSPAGTVSPIIHLLTLEEAAAELRVSPATVSRLCNGKIHGAPKLPYLRLGRRYMIRKEDLRTFAGYAAETEGVKSPA